MGAGTARGHLPDSGAPTSRPGPAETLPSALSSPSPAGRSRPASVRARPRAGHPSPPPRSPGSGAALSGIRKQCILLKFRDRRRTHAGGRTRVRRRPKVHSGASAAEQTEWACRGAGAARARGSGAEGQADPPRVPPTRDLSLPCTLKGRRAARCRRAVPKTQDPVLRRSPDPRAPAPPRRGPAPRAHLDTAPLAAHAGRHVRGAASLPAELATRAGRQDPLPPVVEVRVLRRAPSAARPAALPGLPQAPRTHVVAVPILVALAAVAAGEGHTVGVNVQLTHWGAGRVRGPLVAAHRPCPPPARAWVCPSPDLTFLNVWGPVVRDRSTLDPAAGWEPASLRLSRLAHLGTQGPHPPPGPPPQTCGPTASGAGPPGRRDQAPGAGPRGRLAVPSQRRPGASRPFRHTEQNLRFQSPRGPKQWATGTWEGQSAASAWVPRPPFLSA